MAVDQLNVAKTLVVAFDPAASRRVITHPCTLGPRLARGITYGALELSGQDAAVDAVLRRCADLVARVHGSPPRCQRQQTFVRSHSDRAALTGTLPARDMCRLAFAPQSVRTHQLGGSGSCGQSHWRPDITIIIGSEMSSDRLLVPYTAWGLLFGLPPSRWSAHADAALYKAWRWCLEPGCSQY